MPLYGIDGLYWDDDALFAVQNGVRPWRLMRFLLNDDISAIDASKTIDIATPGSFAMTGAVDGRRFFHIGRGSAPTTIPSQFAAPLAGELGRTVIMTAPLD